MASIFKRGGKRNRSGVWHIAYYERPGIRRVVRGCADLKATEALANKLETEAFQRRKGIIDPSAGRYAEAEAKPLVVVDSEGKITGGHVPEFHSALLAKGTTAKHADHVRMRAGRIIDLCNAECPSDLTPSAVQTAVGSLRDDEDLSLQTCNHYLRAIKQFSRWLRRDGRIREDTLAHLSGYNVKLDRRHDRRALTEDELVRLIQAAERGPEIRGVTGPHRAMLYRLATGTGFRVSELASLTPESFDLSADPPTVTIEAAYSKHRRQDVQPIRYDLAAALEALPDTVPDSPTEEIAKATGTYDAVEPHPARSACAARRDPQVSKPVIKRHRDGGSRDKRKSAKTPEKRGECQRVSTPVGNTPGRTRTSDLRFRRPLLYPAELRAFVLITS